MENNKSEELAKLLGIVPRVYTDYDDCDKECNTFDDCRDCKRPKIITTKYYYPDFTKPSNFVKLYELNIFEYVTLGQIINSIYHTGSRIEFLSILIKRLKSDFYDVNQIKQQIQKSQWEY